ncbi:MULTISPECIES: YggT family protein [unclassified Micromonospora]|uniref:YggT family protein n=1 Tax=unclassified Micromonospora TaxID=2617518 RepID=UPI002E1E78D7
MGPVLGIVSLILLLMQLLLVARVVLDWSVALAGPSAPGSIRSRLSAGARAVTEPILAPVRRFLPPLRLGTVSIDLAFIVVFIAILVIRQLIS